MARETMLLRALAPARAEYDVVLIDCPPSLGIFTANAPWAADFVLVPAEAADYAVAGLTAIGDGFCKIGQVVSTRSEEDQQPAMYSSASGDSGVYRFSLGDFVCYALRDGSFNYPPGSLFANAPEAQLARSLQEHGLPLEHVTTPYTCLLVDTGRHKVMIDTGAGNIGAMAAQVFPGIDHSTTITGQLLQNLRAARLSPEEVDAVLITHAHPDHIGGTLDEAGRLVFGNAHYFIAEDEWRFWTSEAADARAAPSMVNIARRNLAPLEKRVTLVQDGFEVVPGITILATPGHTPGHLAVSVTSDAQDAERRPCLLHLSDVVLHPLHLEYPMWTPVFDMDPEQAEQSKRRVFDQAARDQRLLFAHHFPPFPSLGRVTKQGQEGQEGQGWKWHPLEATRQYAR